MVGGCDFTPEADAYETVGPETRWERKAILDKMLDVIHNELTEKQRTVLLAELKGMPQGEIARISTATAMPCTSWRTMRASV